MQILCAKLRQTDVDQALVDDAPNRLLEVQNYLVSLSQSKSFNKL